MEKVSKITINKEITTITKKTTLTFIPLPKRKEKLSLSFIFIKIKIPNK